MKRVICSILFLCSLILIISGCKSNETSFSNVNESTDDLKVEGENYSILIYGASDSIEQANHSIEYPMWSKNFFIDPNAPSILTLSTPIGTLEGTYNDSYIRTYDYFQTNLYLTSNYDAFGVDSDGNFNFFYWGTGNSSIKTEILTEEECIEIASDFLSNFVDPKEYTIETSFDELLQLYAISFVKYIGDLRTADEANISVTTTGELYSFASTMLGRISADASPNFDIEEITNLILERLNTIYAGAFTVYDEVRFQDFTFRLTKTSETKYALACTLVVRCICKEGEHSKISGERISFIIQK